MRAKIPGRPSGSLMWPAISAELSVARHRAARGTRTPAARPGRRPCPSVRPSRCPAWTPTPVRTTSRRSTGGCAASRGTGTGGAAQVEPRTRVSARGNRLDRGAGTGPGGAISRRGGASARDDSTRCAVADPARSTPHHQEDGEATPWSSPTDPSAHGSKPLCDLSGVADVQPVTGMTARLRRHRSESTKSTVGHGEPRGRPERSTAGARRAGDSRNPPDDVRSVPVPVPVPVRSPVPVPVGVVPVPVPRAPWPPAPGTVVGVVPPPTGPAADRWSRRTSGS